MKNYDAVVLGSGISALTSALLLSKRGKKVVVLEQYSKFGGYMHGFERFGETFDTGAHYVGGMGEGQPFQVLLRYLGIYDATVFAPLDSAAFDVLHLPSGPVPIPQGYAQAQSELAARFPGHGSEIAAYLRLVKSVSNRFPTYRFDDQTADFPPEALEVSLKTVVEGITSHPPLQCVFYAYCNLHGVHPDDVAFGFHAVITDSLLEGARGLNGGGDRLAALFVEAIRRHGGEVLAGQRVTAIEVDEHRHVRVVRTQNGGEFAGDWVISSLHPKATFGLLSRRDFFPPVFTERLRALRESTGVFGMYAVCSARPLTSPAQNHYFFKSENPAEMFAATNPGHSPAMVFLSSPKRHWDLSESRFPICLHAPAPTEWFRPWRDERYGRRSKGYQEFKATLGRAVLNAIEPHWPGFAEKVSTSVTSTPLTNRHFNGSDEGSAYGIYHSLQNTGARALGPRTKVLNLLLTGQNCVFPGLLGAAISGLRTTGHIVGIKTLLGELKALGTESA